MSSRCTDIQRRLTLDGARSLAGDAAAQQHLAECEDCFAVLEGLDVLDRTLARLPDLEPPEALLGQLLERIAIEPFDDLPEERPGWSERAGRLLAPLARPGVRWRVAAMLVVGLGTALLVPTLWLRRNLALQPLGAKLEAPASVVDAVERVYTAQQIRVGPPPEGQTGAASGTPSVDPESVEKLKTLGYLGGGDAGEGAEAAQSSASSSAESFGERQDRNGRLSGDSIDYRGGSPLVESDSTRPAESNAQLLEKKVEVQRRARQLEEQRETPSPAAPPAVRGQADLAPEPLVLGDASGLVSELRRREAEPTVEARNSQAANEPAGAVEEEIEVTTELMALDQTSAMSATVAGSPADADDEADLPLWVGGEAGAYHFADKEAIDNFEAPPEAVASAEELLAARQRTEGLVFQDPTGYWRNTYVPGDRLLRLLSSRLLRPDAATPQRDALALLHDAAHRPAQPFDPPQGAALALALSADRRAVTGESRVLLQVGLQATERRAGRRPPLDVAIVLDLDGDLLDNAPELFRALVLALSEARQPDDRFRLIVAGRPGGLLVGPDDFRFGPLRIALDSVFGVGGSTGPTLDLPAALRLALATVKSEEQPGSPLGSSGLLLATPRQLGDELPEIERLAHTAAVASVPLSAIGIGQWVDSDELDRLAISGQGSRRLLASAASAAQLVDRELAAASRAVARAVRLSIRLAPGVQLVDVVGSESLDQRAAQRVRDAELSVDLKLARSLGIAADRGDDEEGIQIVIPAYFTGDAHVILVDVVVPGAGPVADVSVRYKDLVQSRNGVAAAHLELPRGDDVRGPLELNVLHNLLVLQLVDALDEAGKAVAAGQRDAAQQRLQAHLSLLEGLGELLPGFAGSREVVADRTLLEGYLSVLASGDASEETLQRLSDSLQYAARLKVLPAPEKTEP